RERVCVSGSIVLKPGDSIRPLDAPCKSLTCTDKLDSGTGFLQLLSSNLACDCACGQGHSGDPSQEDGSGATDEGRDAAADADADVTDAADAAADVTAADVTAADAAADVTAAADAAADEDVRTEECCSACSRGNNCTHITDTEIVSVGVGVSVRVSSCLLAECTSDLQLLLHHTTCPHLDHVMCKLAGGSVVTDEDGCCQTCDLSSASCQLSVVHMDLDADGCLIPSVAVRVCQGLCASSSEWSGDSFRRLGVSCSESGPLAPRIIACPTNPDRTATVLEPAACACVEQ
uniref:Otogelin-like n=1 Tax=Petromyzon marinus TaxID=7757 RepID=A0AAJ7SIQ7_PETMA